MPRTQWLQLWLTIAIKVPTRLFVNRQEFCRIPIHSLAQLRLGRYLINIQCRLKEKIAIDIVDRFKIVLADAE